MHFTNLDISEQYSVIKEILKEDRCIYVFCKNKLVCILSKYQITYSDHIMSELDLNNYYIQFLYKYPHAPDEKIYCNEKNEIFKDLTPFLFSLKL